MSAPLFEQQPFHLPGLHLQDDQLLLFSNGELAQAASAQLSTHIESCQTCQARLAELESSLSEFTQAHPSVFGVALPSAAGPRALLIAQLSDESARENLVEAYSKKSAPRTAWSLLNWRNEVALTALALIVVLIAHDWRRAQTGENLAATFLPVEPDARFTPGAIISATRSQICSNSLEMSTAVPASLKTKVLQLYGVANMPGDTYEVDYLITPELGGATDVRNLWPEPYGHSVWNAHVKDRLEDRLREMVCRGDLDLATAQRDISTDWIAAYRKYFHEQVPVLTGSS